MSSSSTTTTTTTNTTTTNMKPIMMMNASNSDAMDDPFADLPTAATDDPAFSATPQLVSPLEFGTGIKYLQEQHQQQHQHQSASTTVEKETDATEATLEEEEDTDVLLEDAIDASPVVEPTTEE